ncbi:E3 ubiquitin-protein ligase COP1-like [Gossypium arboreum]|uniref:Uncharacterized protein n=1 Tax=Gossypium arboreum TaxID=29729 RepID=A0ABR0PA91_GOSAR|nr:E3 ubiquitin-protein ligase COP1-like [Gossypium arboreum]KAK5818132.1 hypothetical protein PVK06_023063 [Gossypium arboreum]
MRIESPFTITLTVSEHYEISIKELDNLLSLLAEKKRKTEQDEAERNMQILLDFLNHLQKQKVNELNEVETDLHFIKEDINSVERHKIDLYHARDRYSLKLRMLGDDSSTRKPWDSSIERNNSGITSSSLNVRVGMSARNLQNKKSDGKTQINDLQECYLQKRRQLANQLHIKQERDKNFIHNEGYNADIADFQFVLNTFTQYRQYVDHWPAMQHVTSSRDSSSSLSKLALELN